MEPLPDAPLFYRRAVGLEARASLCEGCARVTVTSRRHGGDTLVELDLEEAARLFRLRRWCTPAEANVPEHTLRRWVEENLAFDAVARPVRHFHEGTPWDGVGVAALAPHVWPTLVMDHGGERGPVPFMPRVGSLRRARLTGVHLAVMEAGAQVLGVALACCARHGMVLRELVAALHARVPTGSLGSDHLAVLRILDQLGLLEPAPPPWDVGPGTLTWLGHAAVLLSDGGTRVLVDPLFHPLHLPPALGATQPPDVRGLGGVDAVLITHGDNDHFNVQALARIPRDTRLLLPRVAKARPWQVDLHALTQLLGFTRVTWMEPWEQVRVGRLDVVAAPFIGEDWGLELPKLTWLLKGPTANVYFGADAAEMPEVHARLGREHRVDVALLGVSGCAEAMVMPRGFGYGNFYEAFVDPAHRNRWVQHCAGPAESARAARLLGARHVFGYAAGGADFIPVAYSDRGTHEELAALLTERDGPQPWTLPLGAPQAIPRRP